MAKASGYGTKVLYREMAEDFQEQHPGEQVLPLLAREYSPIERTIATLFSPHLNDRPAEDESLLNKTPQTATRRSRPHRL
jgi:hypothetical protein